MQKIIFKIVLAATALSFAACDSAPGTLVSVYKTPTCGCCKKWVEHLKANGFSVETTDLPDVRPIKTANGVPAQLQSCHTALVDGYVVEGHVPAEDLRRLLEERPDVLGIAVPKMPVGSPGMEGPHPVPYEVLSFDAQGKTRTFATHQP